MDVGVIRAINKSVIQLSISGGLFCFGLGTGFRTGCLCRLVCARENANVPRMLKSRV